MTLTDGHHVRIGGVGYRLDEGYESLVGRRCYIHAGRSLFAEQFNITGVPGARSLRQDELQWHLTNFDGEGQVTLLNDDEDSARLFYRSEGLNFKVPGQFSLNKSAIATTVPVSPNAGSTFQGNANFADVVGTSTTNGTDRRISAVNDVVRTSSNYSTATASNVQVDFYIYRELFADNDTSIAGSALKRYANDGEVVGDDFRLRLDSAAISATKSTGTHFTAGERQRVELYCHAWQALTRSDKISVWLTIGDVTGGGFRILDKRRASPVGTSNNPSTPSVAATFVPEAGRDYRFHVSFEGGGVQSSAPYLRIDEIRFGPEELQTSVDLSVWNQDTSAVLVTRTLNVMASTAGTRVASIVFTTGAATNYRFQVTRNNTSGPDPQAPWVDKVVATELGENAPYTLDCCEVGLGGRIWLAGHRSGANSSVWRYDPTDDDWGDDVFCELNADASSNATVRWMTHSDEREYFGLSDGSVRTVNGAGADVTYATGFTGLVGGCISQNRLFLLVEGSGGIDIYTLPVDGAAVPYTSASATVNTVNLAAGVKTPDANLRARICSTPRGARFFVNYGDVTCKIFEVDASGSQLQPQEVGDLGHGIKGHAIAFEGGITWVAVTYTAESDQTALSALWWFDLNGVPERAGFFRADSPAAFAPIDLEPYQTDLFILQGPYLWRYSMTRGGLFLEYQHEPTDGTKARSIAVSRGRTFAQYEAEVIVTGTDATYRQSSVTDGNTYTSSIFDNNLPGVRKNLLTLRLLTDTLASGASILLEYQLDASGTWVTAGLATTGAEHDFVIATEQTNATYNALQLRVKLISSNGTATPVVRGIIAISNAADDEEYWDLVLRCEDDDSLDRPDGIQATGAQRLANIVSLKRTGAPFTFEDGYEDKTEGVAYTYRATILDYRAELNAQGEGRVVTTVKRTR